MRHRLADWPAGRRLLMCDETGGGPPIAETLAGLDHEGRAAPWAILVGPEGGFAEPEQWRYEWQRHYSRDEWLDHLPTTGTLTQLAPDQLATVLEAVGTTIDSIGGGFNMEYVTLAAAATRTGDA